MVRIFVAGWLGVAVCAFSSLHASAQEWATKMFQQTNHNFGTVAKGAKTEFRFSFKNLYRDDVHVTGVRASCGCTTPSVTKDTLKSWEVGEIIAHLNTDRFLGQKGATLTVTIDRPQQAEVQLRVDGFIRGDVVVNPEEVNLGSVEQGTAQSGRATVEYVGQRDWKIVTAKSDSPYIEVTATEAKREANRVVYDLLIRLSDQAPPGYVNQQLKLVTNDSEGKEFPIVVQGRVLSPLTVSPKLLSFGAVPSGQRVSKHFVVTAKRPFRITAVRCDDADFSFDSTDEAKTMHLITATFTPSATPRHSSPKILIETDLAEGLTADLTALADIVAAPETASITE